MARPPDLSGIIPPIVTPIGADGAVDGSSVERLCNHLLTGGVNGIFAAGSTGEAALLGIRQYRALIAATVAAVDHRVPVLAGLIRTGTEPAVELGELALEQGVDYVVATAPFYISAHPSELIRHYQILSDRFPGRVVAYNYPTGVGQTISPQLVKTLHDEGLIVGYKDSGTDLAATRQVITLAPNLPVFTGSETLTDYAVQAGAAGAVPGLANIAPRAYVDLWLAARDHRYAAAAQCQARLTALFGIIDVADRQRIGATAAALGSFKSALTSLGIISDPRLCEPLGRLSRHEHNTIAELVSHCAEG